MDYRLLRWAIYGLENMGDRMTSSEELLKLFEDMVARVEKEAPIPFYRKLLKQYEKAIKLLADNKMDGECITLLENEHYRLTQTMQKHIAERVRINLSDMKNDLIRGTQ